MSALRDQRSRIWGLDTLRFFAALWVVFGHCGYFPLTDGLDRTSTVGLIVQGIYGNLFAAVPAVIVFFVISGFCIHHPHLDASHFQLLPYLARRYLRIGIPLAVAVLLARPLDVNLAIFHNSILWSLVAELIYYSLYPIFRSLRARFGWGRLICVAYVLAYCGVLVHPAAKDYSPYGVGLNWLIALPCWLLGCLLAEQKFEPVAAGSLVAQVWRWRLGIWFLSWVCSVLRFHSPLGYPWTLNLFALAVFFWLRVEIATFRARRGLRLWEWAGQWSYSIYLMHMIANEAFARLPTPNLGANLNWVQRFIFVLGFAYAFYLVVEKPGHLLARHISNWLKRPSSGKDISKADDAGAIPQGKSSVQSSVGS